jgi:hypothetical protein
VFSRVALEGLRDGDGDVDGMRTIGSSWAVPLISARRSPKMRSGRLG